MFYSRPMKVSTNQKAQNIQCDLYNGSRVFPGCSFLSLTLNTKLKELRSSSSYSSSYHHVDICCLTYSKILTVSIFAKITKIRKKMIKKTYFLFLLPLGLIPMVYYTGVDHWLSMLNLMKKRVKENILTQMRQKIQIDNKVKQNVSAIPSKQGMSTISTQGVTKIKAIHPKHISSTINMQGFTKSKVKGPSTTNMQRVTKRKALFEQHHLILGPTATNYNETPRSDQVGMNLKDDITVVSAYFWLPPFPKGSLSSIRSSDSYQHWMKAFRWIINPMVIYTDNEKTYTRLTTLFRENNKTSVKVIKIHHDTLWSFRQLPTITKIFKQKNYPVHYPNTVIPAYNCVTHAKYEILKIAIEKNWFKTKYFIWLDIGYFRTPITQKFGLSLPKNFDERRMGITRVGNLEDGIQLETAVRQNRNWIAGGCMLGRFDILHTFCIEYLDFVNEAIKQKMVGVEQQLMYAMYSGKKKPKTSLQLCYPGWFCLGQHAANAWWLKNN